MTASYLKNMIRLLDCLVTDGDQARVRYGTGIISLTISGKLTRDDFGRYHIRITKGRNEACLTFGPEDVQSYMPEGKSALIHLS